MALDYRQFRDLSKDQLVAEYDRLASSTQVGLAYVREELARREFDEQNQRMLAMTHDIRIMTRVITGLTVLNVLLVVWALVRA